MSFKELKDRIKKNEGYSDKPYQDQLGFYTIGYGHLITEKENKYYIKKFKKNVRWSPKKIQVFPGKIDYPKYNFLDKHMVRLIMYFSGGPTDLSKSYEFTDWKEVDRFADEILESDIK